MNYKDFKGMGDVEREQDGEGRGGKDVKGKGDGEGRGIRKEGF